jgi:hypothetical protein
VVPNAKKGTSFSYTLAIPPAKGCTFAFTGALNTIKMTFAAPIFAYSTQSQVQTSTTGPPYSPPQRFITPEAYTSNTLQTIRSWTITQFLFTNTYEETVNYGVINYNGTVNASVTVVVTAYS